MMHRGSMAGGEGAGREADLLEMRGRPPSPGTLITSASDHSLYKRTSSRAVKA